MNDRPREYDRELEEAVLLPEGDSTREEARRSIESQGEEGARRWAELLDEQERLRTALRATSIPPGLERRLLDIPRRRGPERPQVKRVWSAAAAATIVVALTAALLLFLPRSTDPDAAAERLAALATHDHLSQPELVVTTRDRAEFTAALGARAPFSVRIPAEMGGASLIGGRLCTFGESPIIYSRWRGSDGDAELSLYQVRREDFGVSKTPAPRRIDLPSGGGHGECRVTLWCDGDFAFAIVRDRPRRGGADGS